MTDRSGLGRRSGARKSAASRKKTVRRAEVLPVSAETEVLVVGGGPAGVSAAFAAARLGAKVLLVEQFNCLGGVATAGGHNHICLFSEWGTPVRVVGGVLWEACRRTAQLGYGVCTNSSADYELEGLKLVLEQMAEECGAKLLYHTFFAEALVERGKVTGAVIQNKTGRSVVRARRVVDCTGDGDVAARAGCNFDQGEKGSGLCQPLTLMFTLGGVDWEKVRAFRKDDWKLSRVWARAQAEGAMRPFQDQIMGWLWTPTRPDQVGVNFTHLNHLDGARAEDLTSATLEGRKQVFECLPVYRKYIPGMERCYLISTPNTVGVRETRRIRGLYRLTRRDVMAQRGFADAIGYGSFFIDIHSVSGPGMDRKTWRPPKGFHYQIPYRILVPEKREHLLVAGRCASADHEALGSLRVMPQCAVMGQAAGAAAVISLRRNCAVRDVPPLELQAALRSQGCLVSAEDVAQANS